MSCRSRQWVTELELWSSWTRSPGWMIDREFSNLHFHKHTWSTLSQQKRGLLCLTRGIKKEKKVKSPSCVWLFMTPWIGAYQTPLSMGIFQARVLEWVAVSSSRGSSQPRDWTPVSRIAGRRFTVWATREVHWLKGYMLLNKNILGNALVLNTMYKVKKEYGALLNDRHSS